MVYKRAQRPEADDIDATAGQLLGLGRGPGLGAWTRAWGLAPSGSKPGEAWELTSAGLRDLPAQLDS